MQRTAAGLSQSVKRQGGINHETQSKFEEAEEKTKTGIILTASAQEKPQVADVIAVGPGKVTDNGAVAPMTVKVGDKVIASKYAGTAVKLDGVEYTVLSEDDILATVE